MKINFHKQSSGTLIRWLSVVGVSELGVDSFGDGYKFEDLEFKLTLNGREIDLEKILNRIQVKLDKNKDLEE